MAAFVAAASLSAIFYDKLGFPEEQLPQCKLLSRCILQCEPVNEDEYEINYVGKFQSVSTISQLDNDKSYIINDDREIVDAESQIAVALGDATKLAATQNFDYSVDMDYTFLSHTHTPKNYDSMDKTVIQSSDVDFPENCEKNTIVSSDESSPEYPNLVWMVCEHTGPAHFGSGYVGPDHTRTILTVYLGITSELTITWTQMYQEKGINLEEPFFMTDELSVGKIDAVKDVFVARFDHINNNLQFRLITKVVVCKFETNFQSPPCFLFLASPKESSASFHFNTAINRQFLDIEEKFTVYDALTLSNESFAFYQISNAASLVQEDVASSDTAFVESFVAPSYQTYAPHKDGLVILHCYFEKAMQYDSPAMNVKWFSSSASQEFTPGSHDLVNEPMVCRLTRFYWTKFAQFSSFFPTTSTEFLIELPETVASLADYRNRVTQYSVACVDSVPGECENLMIIAPSRPTQFDNSAWHAYFTTGTNSEVQKAVLGEPMGRLRVDEDFIGVRKSSGDFTHRATYTLPTSSFQDSTPTQQMIWLRMSFSKNYDLQTLSSAPTDERSFWCMYKFDFGILGLGTDTSIIQCGFDELTENSYDTHSSYLSDFYAGHNTYSDCQSQRRCFNVLKPALNGIYTSVIRWVDGRREFVTDIRLKNLQSFLTPYSTPEVMQTVPGKHSGVAFEDNYVVISETSYQVHHATLKSEDALSEDVKMFKYGSTLTDSFPDKSVKVTLVGGATETKLVAVSGTFKSTVTIGAPSHRVCMGKNFLELAPPMVTSRSDTVAVYALTLNTNTGLYTLKYWYITENGISEASYFNEEPFTSTAISFGNNIGILCNDGHTATEWRIAYFFVNNTQSTFEQLNSGFPFYNNFLEVNTQMTYIMALPFRHFIDVILPQTVKEIKIASHSGDSGQVYHYYASLGLRTGSSHPIFCANVIEDLHTRFPRSTMCTTLSQYVTCESLSMEDTSEYVGNDVLSQFAFGKRDVFALFMCKYADTSTVPAEYEPHYYYYDFVTNNLTQFGHNTDEFFQVCFDNNKARNCVDSIAFRTNIHSRGFDVLFFVDSTVYFFDVSVERGTATFPVSTETTQMNIPFPFQTTTAVYFKGWKGFALYNSVFPGTTVLNLLPSWVDTHTTSNLPVRVAVSNDADDFRAWGECHVAEACNGATVGDYVKFLPFTAGPALDDPDMIKFYFYEYGLPENVTLLLTGCFGGCALSESQENSIIFESNIWSVFDASGEDRNVEWVFGCPSEESKDAVPFFTNEPLSQTCVNDGQILDRLNNDAIVQLKKFRLDETVDPAYMYCFSADRVSLGQPCGQQPVVHGTTHDCGTNSNNFQCVADDEIFDFSTTDTNITSECISMAGTCFDELEYIFSTTSSSTFENCKSSCTNSNDCVGFNLNSNKRCTLVSVTTASSGPFFGKPCDPGVVGYVCRLSYDGGVLTTDVVIDPGATPSFYTDIREGGELLQEIVHGNDDPSSMSMDQSGHETHFIATFDPTFSATGGKIVYTCGQDNDPVSVLFTPPAVEDDPFDSVTVQECYLSTASFQSHHDTRIVPAESGYSTFFDASDTGYYFAHGFDQNNKEFFYKNFNDLGVIQLSQPPTPAFSVRLDGVVPLENWNIYTPFNLNSDLSFAPVPSNTLDTVLATAESSIPYGENDEISKSFWHSMSQVPVGVFINDIRPVTVNDLEGATEQTEYSSKGSQFIDFTKNFAMFKTSDDVGLISDVLWGRFMNYKSFFAQTTKYDVQDETDFLRKYIFSMTEAVTFDLCPHNQFADDPNFGKECVMNRMTHPVMNPLYTEVVTVNGRRLALGFTPYRVAPFMGVYLDYTLVNRRDDNNNENTRMIMPDDDFIQEHGGIGFGAASTSSDKQGEENVIFSFGGLDYSPHSKYRPFEKLPFDMPAPLQWHPVWARMSQTFGCKAEAFNCTYTDDFYDNVVPQTDLGTARNKFTSISHVVGWAHSPDEFWHYYTPRHFQTPSYRESHKCGQGDVTINMALLDDVEKTSGPIPIPKTKSCGGEVKINLPFTKDQKNVDFSRETVMSASQFDEFKFFMLPRVNEENSLLQALSWMQTRKLPYFNKLWSSLLSLESFDPSEYRRSTDNFLSFSKECIDDRNREIHEHYGLAGLGKYHNCRPLKTGTTIMAKHEMGGDSECITNQCATALNNDCVTGLDPAEFTSRYSNKGSSKQVNPYDEFASEVTLSSDFDLYDKDKMTLDNYFWTDSYSGKGKAALLKLEHMESDIGFLSRECLLGQLALIKYIAHFDHQGTTFSSDLPVYQQKFLPVGGVGDHFDLAKVYSPTFWQDQFEAFQSTVSLGTNNLNVRRFCNEKTYGSYDGDRRLAWTSTGASQPTINDLKSSWPTKKSKFKFPSTFASGAFTKELPTEDVQASTCPEEMCIGPYPALLPPFKMNCDFVNIDSKPTPQTDWRTCPMMPNKEFFEELAGKTEGETPFFKRQIWRPPAFWHNKDNLWSSKAYRYDMDTWDTNPQPIDKVFNSSVDGLSATSKVIGRLQCKRVGAVAQQSIVNPDLYYVCGGINSEDIHALGCTMCEVFDVNLGKGATIDRDFNDDSCKGHIVGLRISQGLGESPSSVNFGWVQVQYVCSETIAPRAVPLPPGVSPDNFYLQIPQIMRTIHSIKTSPVPASESKEYNFVQVALKNDHGTMRSFPMGSARIPASADKKLTIYGTPVFCFQAGEATALINIDGVKITVNGLDVLATTEQQNVRKHLNSTGFACVDGNGISQSLNGGTRTMAFWNPLKFNQAKETQFSIEFMATNGSNYAVHTYERTALIDNPDMISVFGEIRWRNGNIGFFQDPAPTIQWGCTQTGTSYVCNADTTCTSSVPCAVEYYDVPTTNVDVLGDAQTNIAAQKYGLYGYLTPRERLHHVEQTKFASFPGAFVLQTDVFGKKDCDTARKALTTSLKAMMLVDRQVLERVSRPHFTEIAPTVIIRTNQACYDNHTVCHTFAKDNIQSPPIKMCTHFTGCNKNEYVDVSSEDPLQFECQGFTACTQKVNSRYTEMGPHAGFRPSCKFVEACAQPGFYRHHEPFDDDLGQVRLGTCTPQDTCPQTSFTADKSTSFKNAQCMQFRDCTDQEYESTSGTGDKNRECTAITVCEDQGKDTLTPATATSDAVCFDIVTTCPFENQYFDQQGKECKDATVCGVRQETKQDKTETTDRQCVNLEASDQFEHYAAPSDSLPQECSFYEVEVPGTGLQTKCQPDEHASHRTEVAMMATASSVGFIAAILRVFFAS